MDSAGWGVKHFNELEGHGVASSESLVPRGGEDQALITFTSGSTGRPKGADRHHAFLWEQHSSEAGLSTNRRADRHDLSTGCGFPQSLGW